MRRWPMLPEARVVFPGANVEPTKKKKTLDSMGVLATGTDGRVCEQPREGNIGGSGKGGRPQQGRGTQRLAARDVGLTPLSKYYPWTGP